MISALHIENLAVIKKLDVDFSAGFTVLTGETGAGKSVMLESLRLLLGAKADKELLRHGEAMATVSAVFRDLSAKTKADLFALSVVTDEEGALELQRSFGEDGKSTSRINGRAVSLSVLKEAASLLLHIHGQEDTAFLRKEESALSILDAAAHNERELAAYLFEYEKLENLRRALEKLEIDEAEKERRIETLRYQTEEIKEVSLKKGDEDALFEEKLRLKNIEKITKQTSFSYRALRGGEKGNVCSVLQKVVLSMEALGEFIPRAAEIAEQLEDSLSELDDVAEEIRAMGELDGEDPTEALDRVETRLADIQRLLRKYGPTEDAVLAYLEKSLEELSSLENLDSRREELTARYAEQLAKAEREAEVLHETRAKATLALEDEVSALLEKLDLPKAKFSIGLEKREREDARYLTESGFDTVSFLATLNEGEPMLPINHVASGGEMARIVLALKCVIARHDGLPTVIFDEVDSGVSGKTSRKIGFCLKEASAGIQMLCITHSAQIASLADNHYLMKKQTLDGRTEASVSLLGREERIAELSRILGGIHITDAQRKAAADMLSYQI